MNAGEELHKLPTTRVWDEHIDLLVTFPPAQVGRRQDEGGG